MKLLNLFLALLNLVYYIIISPVYLPYKLHKYYNTKKWRRNPKVGDKCYFINMFGSKTIGYIDRIDNGKVLFKTKSLNSSSSQWIEVSELNAI
jgi:hypothetical protein